MQLLLNKSLLRVFSDNSGFLAGNISIPFGYVDQNFGCCDSRSLNK